MARTERFIIKTGIADPEVGTGGPETPLWKINKTNLERPIYKAKRFLSNTAPDPIENYKDPSQQYMLGYDLLASETPFSSVSL